MLTISMITAVWSARPSDSQQLRNAEVCGDSAIIQFNRNSLHEELANRLEELIVSAHWEVGQTLPSEREMAEQFSLSRSVVRDAMRILAAKGLVDIRHGVGAVVTQDGRLAFV